MKNLTSFLSLLTMFVAGIMMDSCRSNSHTESGIITTKKQIGNITYLIFEPSSSNVGGITVVNYTADSAEYEFLHPPKTE